MSAAPALLPRTTFETARTTEYFNAKELQAQTGQPVDRFAAMALKELGDNALDACEAARVGPELVITVRRDEYTNSVQVVVQDNGGGLPAATLVRILNFSTRTSDKSAYRAPTRGAQGNAFKTIIGLPWALGGNKPVVIEAQGVRHSIRAWIDPAGEVRIEHEQATVLTPTGTHITLTLPASGQILASMTWARGFSLFNPQATVRFRESIVDGEHAYRADREIEESYHATVTFPDGWRKFLPTDLTSAHWYDADALTRLVFAHIGESRRGGADPTLREFVRQFRGLSGTAKAKSVCDQFPTIRRLSDFEQQQEQIATLLQVMQVTAAAPQPSVLGLCGETHYRTRFTDWYGPLRDDRFWYRKVWGTVGGIPFAFEVAIADTLLPHADNQQGLFCGVNFSPSFGDPFASTRLVGQEFEGYGAHGFLEQAQVLANGRNWAPKSAVAAVHLVCPLLTFLDRGKSRLSIPAAMAEQIAQAVWRAAQPLWREGERRRKDAARAERSHAYLQREWGAEPTIKDAVFMVMPEAIRRATTDGDQQLPASVRSLFYQVRPLAQQHTSKALDWGYFSQTLFPLYRTERGGCELIYNDPRGVLYEPHTGESLHLGTREVDAYDFPAWVYDKILYVEKKGLWPVLKAARIAEHYDLAIIAAEGYATEAIRTLFQHADQQREYQLFVLHDADPDGYNIARTLQEETRRMPGYHVKVIDLGLKLEEGLAMDLPTETFKRERALQSGLVLTPTERVYFEGRPAGRKKWIAERIELNAMPAPLLITWLKGNLDAHGCGKLIPPIEAQAKRLQEQTEQRIRAEIRDRILRDAGYEGQVAAACTQLDALVAQEAPTLTRRVQQHVAHHLEDPWTTPVEQVAGELARMLTRRKEAHRG